MTNEIGPIHCLFPCNIFTFRAGERHTSLRPHAQLPLTREKCRPWWLIEYEHEQIKEISCSPGIMAAFRDLILGARIGSETRRDPKRKMMIALAAAFSVCTATMTSATPAAFARGGGSFGGGIHGFVGGGFGGHGFAVGRSDGGHFRGGFGHLGRGFRDRRFGRFGFGLYGYAGGFHSDYGYGACLVPPPNGYAWACY